MNKPSIITISLLLGAVLGAGAVIYLRQSTAPGMESSGEPQPLYWVAPMDPTYRRDGPGKSPMGMDLVPVYEDGGGMDDGVVSISPVVENNLGVRTARVEMGRQRTPIRTVGYVSFDEDRLLHLHPRVEGWIETLHVKTEGEFIEAGQPLYAIYAPELVNAQEELVLAVERDNARLIRSAEERLLALQVPQRRIDQVKADRTVSQTVTVYAPQGGLLAELHIRQGHFVQPGSPMMSIGVLDEVWVIAEVFERQVALVSQGDPVTMTLDYLPGRQWQGEVDFIYPTLDQTTRTVPVRLRFANADQVLKPNMFAQVTINTNQKEAVLLVPNEAVIRSGTGDRVVLAMGEGRYKSVTITAGRRGDTHTEVLAGLREGDTVVTSAHFLLDSESSISSDFRRMDAAGTMTSAMGAMQGNSTMNMEMDTPMPMDETAEEDRDGDGEMDMEMGAGDDMTMAGDARWVQARVERVLGEAMLSVSHDPIPAWEWPAMTMMFEVADGVDTSGVEAGSTIEVQITREDGGQKITGIRPAE